MSSRDAARRTFVIKQAAGCDIHADAYWTPGAPPGPALLWLHGGALITGSRLMLPAEQAAYYTAAGFTVVAADYRLAPETRLPDILSDVCDALAWVRGSNHGLPVDPGRVAIVGHSAGGYLALLGGQACQPMPRAIVSFYGYGDIGGDWCTRPDGYYRQQGLIPDSEALSHVGRPPLSEADAPERLRFYVYCRQTGLWPWQVTGLRPVSGAAALDAWGPARRAAAASAIPPALLIHGADDTDVPAAQSCQMAEALAAAGAEHELLVVAGRGHGFDLEAGGLADAATAAAFARAVSFLRKHTAQD